MPSKHPLVARFLKQQEMIEANRKSLSLPDKPKGLGDTIEKVLEKTGIKHVAKKALGEDCGCNKRKETLNSWFPYKDKK